jgi:hypothetical protein
LWEEGIGGRRKSWDNLPKVVIEWLKRNEVDVSMLVSFVKVKG